jgi:hypothetical protein
MSGGDPSRLIERLILGDARVAAGHLTGDDRGLTQQEITDSGEGEVSSAAALTAADQVQSAKPDLQPVATRAREAFVAAVLRANQSWPAEVLLADLLLLTAALQDAMRQGQLTDAEYARHMIEVLSAVLGQATAPYPKALESVPLDQRLGAWARGWLLVGPLLVAWQVILAQLAARSEEELDAPARRAAVPLWVRGLIRHAPASDLEHILEEAERQLPAMERFGALWVADRWPYWAERLPLRAFLREVVSDALALERLEVPLGAALRQQAGKQDPVEEDDPVIGRGRDGRLAVGFMDTGVRALLCDGAFQDASSREVHRSLRRVGLTEVMTFHAAERVLETAPVEVRAALKVLAAIAP